MEAIIFCGIQASGKTSFYRQRFFDTHVRISMDLVRTRRREQLLLEACIAGKQPFVVDNTNVMVNERARYIAPARAACFRIIGYFFPSDPKTAFERNRARAGSAAVPAAGLFGTQKRLQQPALEEGFERIYRVELLAPDSFQVTQWLPLEPAPT